VLQLKQVSKHRHQQQQQQQQQQQYYRCPHLQMHALQVVTRILELGLKLQ
jgi:hypothetical protein